jgi:hypothetical protein
LIGTTFSLLLKKRIMMKSFHTEFIRDKMLECGQAMIYRYIDETTRQVLSFEKHLCFNTSGKITFYLNGNFADKYTGGLFPVELFFYKKGKPFYITAKGIAEKSINDSDVDAPEIAHEKLIKVSIGFIDYTELKLKRDKNFFNVNYNTFFGYPTNNNGDQSLNFV